MDLCHHVEIFTGLFQFNGGFSMGLFHESLAIGFFTPCAIPKNRREPAKSTPEVPPKYPRSTPEVPPCPVAELIANLPTLFSKIPLGVPV